MQLMDLSLTDPVVLGAFLAVAISYRRLRDHATDGWLQKRTMELGVLAAVVYALGDVLGSLVLSIVAAVLLFAFTGLSFYSYFESRESLAPN